MASVKGPGAPQQFDGAALRVAIVHARWNSAIVERLVAGTTTALRASGVREANIVVQSVPGSWELPLAVQRLYAASQVQAAAAAGGDLLGPSASTTDLVGQSQGLGLAADEGGDADVPPSTAPFDAVIAIGVLIKGETMHFEYIADAVSHGLMRVQLDLAVPLVFGVLTVLNEEQAWTRAGVWEEPGIGHNHGKDWGNAAVELGVRRRQWAKGKIV